MVRLFVRDGPVGRYAETKAVKAFKERISSITRGPTSSPKSSSSWFRAEDYLECSEVEARTISGQMANMASSVAWWTF